MSRHGVSRSRNAAFEFVTRLLLIPLLVGVASCRGDAREGVPRAEILSPRVLYDGDDMAEPMAAAVVGDHLVFTDNLADTLVRVLRLSDGRIVHTLGRKGGGPGEFRAVWGIQPEPGSPDAFWLYDPGLARLTRVRIADLASGLPPAEWKMLDIPAPVPLTGPLWVADSALVSAGLFTEPARLARLNARGEVVRLVGAPPPGAASVPLQVRSHAYQSMADYNAGRRLVVLANRHADRIEVLRLDGGLVREIRGPRRFGPAYRVADRGGTPVLDGGRDLRYGYVDVETTADRIYALYSGRTLRERGRSMVLGEEVHVFGWDGRLRRVLRLDGDHVAIALPSSGKKLYALRMHPKPAVVEYEL